MPAELNVTKFGNDCASLEDMRQQLVMLDDALGNPTVPRTPDAPTVENVYYDNTTNNFVTNNGDVLAGSGVYTAGCGIAISEEGVISVVTDGGTTTDCVGGQIVSTVEGGGGGTPSDVIHFELIEDMDLADVAKLAKPVDEAGAIDSGADSFYVIDQENRYVGKAAYTDGNTAAATYNGYRGHAIKIYDDYMGGLAGYRIIEMESPAAFLRVQLLEDVALGAAQCIIKNPGEFGHPHSWRAPRIASDDYDIIVYDDLPGEPAENALEDQHWTARYDEKNDKYIFWAGSTKQTATVTNAMALITGVVPARGAVSGDMCTPGKLIAGARVYEPNPDDGLAFLTVKYSGDGDYNPMDAWNFSLTEFDATGSDDGILVAGQVFTKSDDAVPPNVVAVFVINSDKDFASLPGFDKDEFQIPYHDESEKRFQLGTPIAKLLKKLAGWVLGSNQSVGHDADGDPGWQNDETCE